MNLIYKPFEMVNNPPPTLYTYIQRAPLLQYALDAVQHTKTFQGKI